jgi:type IV pilus assembly protein PilM
MLSNIVMSNFLSKIGGGIFSRQSDSVLGIDIGSSSIKIVQLRRKSGRAVLDTYGELALGPYANLGVGSSTSLPTEKIVEALGDLLREKEVNVTAKVCGIAIPFASSLMTVMQLPAVAEKQLATMVPLEARKYIPVPISEVTLDWSIVPKDLSPRDTDSPDIPLYPGAKPPTPKIEVLIVALHNETIAKYKDIVTKSALETSFFEIEIFSTMRSILDQETSPVMILDMGATSTKLYIIEKGILRGSHTVNKGSQSITTALSKSLGISMSDAEVLKREQGLMGVANGIGLKDIIVTTLAYIFGESNRVILDFEKKYNKNMSKVILVGGGSALKGIIDIAKTSFQTEVVAGDPFSKVVTPAFLENILRETGPEFAVAVGVALRRLQEME